MTSTTTAPTPQELARLLEVPLQISQALTVKRNYDVLASKDKSKLDRRKACIEAAHYLRYGKEPENATKEEKEQYDRWKKSPGRVDLAKTLEEESQRLRPNLRRWEDPRTCENCNEEIPDGSREDEDKGTIQ